MSAHLRRLRESATAAHVLPLAVFMLLNGIPTWLKIENPELPWHQRAPEHWMYPVQTLFVGALLCFFAKHYRLAPWRGLGLATALGAAGMTIWIAPAWLYSGFTRVGESIPEWGSWFGLVERSDGFNPEILSDWPSAQIAAIGMRFVRLVILVPLIEEIFWRGFLMRYVSAGDGRWQSAPFGSHSWKVYGVVTLCVMLAHRPEDYLAALIWGSLVYLVAVRTRSLGACVVMHAVANLLLGLYVMQTRQWGFW